LSPVPAGTRAASDRPSARNLAGEADELFELVGDIYDAALDPMRWPKALDRAARFVGGAAAAVYGKDASRKSGEFYYDNGCTDAGCRKLYSERYVGLDPTTASHVFAEVDEPLATDDLVPYREFVETRFYQEWAHPQGLAHGLSTVLHKAPEGAVLFGVFRQERDEILGARSRMRLVSPHIRRAVLVGRNIDCERSEAASLADVMDGLSTGVFLIEAGGRLLHANASGRAILAKDGVLRTINGKVAARGGPEGEALRAAFAAASVGDLAIGADGLGISLAAPDGERFTAHILPLTGGARREKGTNHQAACALFVRKAELSTESPAAIVARTFKLTPTELRVLLAIVDVGGSPQAAEALGIAEITVKTHLGRIYGKTGTGRHAELARLVASYSNPLLS
jgi:DNA-binding CsgD family transcriptional regulator